MTDLPPIKQLLQQNDLWANKKFGQHFLLDPQILDTITSYAGDVTEAHIIEIGPGPGGLTRALLARGASVTAVEKDERFRPLLEPLAAAYPGKFRVIFDDALKVDLTTLSAGPRKIVANLPYNVGTALLTNWFTQIAEDIGAFERMTLMFQKEVAKRVAAEADTKDYGRLSVISQFLCDTEWHQNLPAGAFTPPPKVASAVISLTPKVQLSHDIGFAALEKLVAMAFNQRRKMLRQSLKPLGVELDALFESAEIDGTKRAENLNVDDFCRLAALLKYSRFT